MNTRLLSSSSITGTSVENASGEDLGNIKDLMINTSNGKIQYAVLSFGGFLGLGDKLFAVPWRSIRIDRENEEFLLDVDKERLKNAPGFNKDHWPSASDPYFQSVNTFYTETISV